MADFVITYITQIMMALMMVSMFSCAKLREQPEGKNPVWETESEIANPADPVRKIKDGSVEFKDVCFVYPGGSERVLRDINLRIESGEIIGIIGSTGSSKTTLVQLIPRLYDVTKGKVVVGGVDVRITIRNSAGSSSFVLQHPAFWHDRDNMKRQRRRD